MKIYTAYNLSKDINFESYGIGEWCDEPHTILFEYLGYKCEIIRCLTGALNGYCYLKNTDRFFEVHYDHIPIKVHGGLTFSSKVSDNTWKIGFDTSHINDICPLFEKFLKKEINDSSFFESIKEGRVFKEKWEIIAREHGKNDLFTKTYKNVNFCIEECKSMVRQLRKLNKEKYDKKL